MRPALTQSWIQTMTSKTTAKQNENIKNTPIPNIKKHKKEKKNHNHSHNTQNKTLNVTSIATSIKITNITTAKVGENVTISTNIISNNNNINDKEIQIKDKINNLKVNSPK